MDSEIKEIGKITDSARRIYNERLLQLRGIMHAKDPSMETFSAMLLYFCPKDIDSKLWYGFNLDDEIRTFLEETRGILESMDMPADAGTCIRSMGRNIISAQKPFFFRTSPLVRLLYDNMPANRAFFMSLLESSPFASFFPPFDIKDIEDVMDEGHYGIVRDFTMEEKNGYVTEGYISVVDDRPVLYSTVHREERRIEYADLFNMPKLVVSGPVRILLQDTVKEAEIVSVSLYNTCCEAVGSKARVVSLDEILDLKRRSDDMGLRDYNTLRDMLKERLEKKLSDISVNIIFDHVFLCDPKPDSDGSRNVSSERIAAIADEIVTPVLREALDHQRDMDERRAEEQRRIDRYEYEKSRKEQEERDRRERERKRRLEQEDEPDHPFDCSDEELEEWLQGIWDHKE